MKVNVWSWTVIVILFFAITVSMLNIGNKAIITNNNLDQDSRKEILGLNTELYEDYNIQVENNQIVGYKYNESTENFGAAESFEREFLESRTSADDFSIGLSNIGKIPESAIGGLGFTSINDWKFYLGLLSILITLGVALIVFKLWKTGKGDND